MKEREVEIINLKREYKKVLNSGLFFEFYPECTGVWDNDKTIFAKKFFERFKNMKDNQVNYYQVDESKQLRLLYKEGFKLNPNEKVVNAIVKRIFENDGECPCHNESYDKKCPCSDYREKGICHCNLYIKE